MLSHPNLWRALWPALTGALFLSCAETAAQGIRGALAACGSVACPDTHNAGLLTVTDRVTTDTI